VFSFPLQLLPQILTLFSPSVSLQLPQMITMEFWG
jgi:hypothetical protein